MTTDAPTLTTAASEQQETIVFLMETLSTADTLIKEQARKIKRLERLLEEWNDIAT